MAGWSAMKARCLLRRLPILRISLSMVVGLLHSNKGYSPEFCRATAGLARDWDLPGPKPSDFRYCSPNALAAKLWANSKFCHRDSINESAAPDPNRKPHFTTSNALFLEHCHGIERRESTCLGSQTGE